MPKKHAGMKLRILFCWSDISGYMTACWRNLSSLENIDLHIIAFHKSTETSFLQEIAHGLKIHWIERTPSKSEIKKIAYEVSPQVIFLCGWFVPAYRSLVDEDWNGNRPQFILTMDTPWRATFRQWVARLWLQRLILKMNAILCSGERSYQYARRLGARKIYKFQYGVDYSFLNGSFENRLKGEWPRRFLFVGRYVEDKGLKDLLTAYRFYRMKVTDPWELHFCGQGPLKELLTGEGIYDHGFVQPTDMNSVWQSVGCLVLPSHFDPWPLIIVEACASGLPVIATHASGSQVEVIKAYYNGLVVTESDGEQLVNALMWIHHHEDLPSMGKASQMQSMPYDASLWAGKINELLKDIRGASAQD